MANDVVINDLKHPNYLSDSLEWYKWRATYEGGQNFIDLYLKKFSSREDDTDFADRKTITYCPAFASAAIDEIKDAIYQRMNDVVRVGGSDSFQDAVSGQDGGVDLTGASMNSYIGRIILPELLVMGRVGIFVDMPEVTGDTIIENYAKRPYIYMYQTEDILNWTYEDAPVYNEFNRILLRECVYEEDPVTGLPKGLTEQYRLLTKIDNVVSMTLYNDKNVIIEEKILNIDKIPFVLVQISHSLMTNVANYQIALLNMASGDVNYCVKANFTFYTEQFDPMASSEWLKPPSVSADGTAANSTPAKSQEIKVGVTAGRKYPKNLDRPGFIHPSAEPLMASMQKQNQMKEEIRQLVKLAVSNLKPRTASADSKKMDYQSLESGLSYIGLELEQAERRIADYWPLYEKNTKTATVKYPTNYSLKSEAERHDEAEKLIKLRGAVPSKKYQKELSKKIAVVTIGHEISNDQLEEIYQEVDSAKAIEFDSETVARDIESGILGPELGSEIRGYPAGESDRAQAARKEHMAEVALAQAQASNQVRGATQTPEAAKGEKELNTEGQKLGAQGQPMGGKSE